MVKFALAMREPRVRCEYLYIPVAQKNQYLTSLPVPADALQTILEIASFLRFCGARVADREVLLVFVGGMIGVVEAVSFLHQCPDLDIVDQMRFLLHDQVLDPARSPSIFCSFNTTSLVRCNVEKKMVNVTLLPHRPKPSPHPTPSKSRIIITLRNATRTLSNLFLKHSKGEQNNIKGVEMSQPRPKRTCFRQEITNQI